MPETTVEQQNEVERQRQLQKRRERTQIFREVFGTPEALTKHGKLILESLHASFGRGLPKNILDDQGRTDMWQTARCLGHFDVLEAIYEAIKWKESDHVDSRQSGTR